MSEENEEGDDKVEQNKYLTFLIGKEGYGISILNVVEIIRYIKITDIPDSVPFIKGIINLRDKIIPVMSVRLRFKLEEKEFDDRTCIVVVNIQGMSIGGAATIRCSLYSHVESKLINFIPKIIPVTFCLIHGSKF